MSTLLDTSRAEAIRELRGELLKTAGKVLQRHGEDPHGREILASGFILAIRDITAEIDPRFSTIVKGMLSK